MLFVVVTLLTNVKFSSVDWCYYYEMVYWLTCNRCNFGLLRFVDLENFRYSIIYGGELLLARCKVGFFVFLYVV